MTSTIPLARRIQVLLNTLIGERYVRRALLCELIDELSLAHESADAVQAGRTLLEQLETGIEESEYQRRIARIVELTAL
jgi:hypothetical protein